MANHWMNARRPGGGLYNSGFKLMTQGILESSTILLSDDDSPLAKDETPASPAYRNAIEIGTRHAPELSEPGTNCILGTAGANQVQSLPRVARVGLKYESSLLIGAKLDAELTSQGIDRLEVQLGLQLRNANEPKRLYKM
jgi:hypothetical protein